MIKCKICNQEFPSQISWKHLKKHNTTVAEYKEKYGEVKSPEFKARLKETFSGENNPNWGKRHSEETKEKISKANTGKTGSNKNKKLSTETKEKIRIKAIERNKTWEEQGNHPHLGTKRTKETREKIRQARSRQVIQSESVYKAIETKKSRGYDLAFFRGKTHSDETKAKISKKSISSNQKRTEKSIADSKNRLKSIGYSFIGLEGNIAKIQCNTCNTVFERTRQYTFENKLDNKMCPTCYPPNKGTSELEKELIDFIKSINKNILTNTRSIIPPQELDIYVPSQKVAIEFNGLYWHSEIFKDKHYHLSKTTECENKGIKLIHIFEDEWTTNKELVKSRILTILKQTQSKIFARKCTIKEISSKEANDFVNKYHLQGRGRSNIRIGLYHKEKLVSVMTFLKGDISKNIKPWELNRFCSIPNTQIIGGASKMFSYFVKNYSPEEIISFADRRWSNQNSVYNHLDFKFVHNTAPNYWYFMPNENTRIHRYSLRKPKDSDLKENELRKSQGWNKIWDCGSIKYSWKKGE